MQPSNPEITLIGSDPSLAYLIGRYAEQSGCRVRLHAGAPAAEEIWAQKPRLVLFDSMESLEAAPALVKALSSGEIPIGVCASSSDEARARELGADHCLLHPLTFESFRSAFSGG